MRHFEYVRADSIRAATVAAEEDATAFIAGGTNLLDLMKLEVVAPSKIIDISRLNLRGIEEEENGGLRIGTLVTNSDLAADRRIRERYSVLAWALLSGATGQLRNKATTGGNLLQRTRCYYFYDTDMPCNKREPGSGCYAIGGVNRLHAVLGASEHCIATHPSDMAIAMRVLKSEVEIEQPDGSRRIVPIGDFYRLPGDTPHIETGLQQGELVTAIILPPPAEGSYQTYRKVRDRASYAFALVSVAAVIRLEQGKFADAALAFGGIAPMPWRNVEVENALIGNAPSDELFEHAADVLLEEAVGYGHNDFKIPLMRRTLKAVLRDAAATGAAT